MSAMAAAAPAGVRAAAAPLLDRRAVRIAMVAFGYALSLPFLVAGVDFEGAVVVLDALPGWTLLAAGYLAWSARPASRTGFLMVVAGIFAALWPGVGHALTSEPLLYTAGITFGSVWVGIMTHVILAFPRGRLASWRERLPALGVYFYVLVALPASAVTRDPAELCAECSDGSNLVFVEGAATVPLDAMTTVVVLLLAPWVLWILYDRWRRASSPARRVLRPVLFATLAAGVTDFAFNAAQVLESPSTQTLGVEGPISSAALAAFDLAAVATGLGFLGGLLRTRVTRSTLGELLVELGGLPDARSLRVALARALGDDSLRVGLWVRDLGEYVDEEGRVLRVSAVDDRGMAVTPVARGGERLAVLVHDRALLDDEGLVESVVGAALLALENERLKAEVRLQLAAVVESRARILEAGDRERERMERDLHAGPQQRLVSLALAVRLAEARARKLGAEGAAELLSRASGEAGVALEDLRELAQGLHPAVLAGEGLGAALESLAERSPVPVSIDGLPQGRLDERAEACAYFVCSEALANVAKYAQATRVRVSARVEEGALHVEVADDGVGGADAGGGSGLNGLQDRVETAGGTLDLVSPPGEGTTIKASIPVDDGQAPSGLTPRETAGAPR